MATSKQRMIFKSIYSRLFKNTFCKNERGATAVEFAIVGLPFFALLMAIFETGLVFYAQTSMDGSMAEAARMIRTGEAQKSGWDQTAFRNKMCASISGLVDCSNSLKIEVLSFPDATAISLPPALDINGDLKNNFAYSPGAPNETVVVRIFYAWNLILGIPGIGLSNMNGNKRLLTAAAAFKNEPFPP
jgi:Flp pilus assembly protein TadG